MCGIDLITIGAELLITVRACSYQSCRVKRPCIHKMLFKNLRSVLKTKLLLMRAHECSVVASHEPVCVSVFL